jgi:hypothetical protein
MKNILKLCIGMWLLNKTVEIVEESTRPSPVPKPEKEKGGTETDYILSLINELKSKKNKSQRDKNNLGLLEVKLKQLLTQ